MNTNFILFALSSIIFNNLNPISSQMMTMPRDSMDPMSGYMNSNGNSKLDIDAILIQRRNLALTTYHLLDDANGHPIFTRPLHDRGKKFIFFNNPSFPSGSGHYIILRKMEHQSKVAGFSPSVMGQQGNDFNKNPQFLYETFSLSFKDSLTGSVSDLDPMMYNSVRLKAGKKLRIPSPIRTRKGGTKVQIQYPGPFRRVRGKRDADNLSEERKANSTFKVQNCNYSNLTVTVSPAKKGIKSHFV